MLPWWVSPYTELITRVKYANHASKGSCVLCKGEGGERQWTWFDSLGTRPARHGRGGVRARPRPGAGWTLCPHASLRWRQRYMCGCVWVAAQTGGGVHGLPQVTAGAEDEDHRVFRAPLPGQVLRWRNDPGRTLRETSRGTLSSFHSSLSSTIGNNHLCIDTCYFIWPSHYHHNSHIILLTEMSFWRFHWHQIVVIDIHLLFSIPISQIFNNTITHMTSLTT